MQNHEEIEQRKRIQLNSRPMKNLMMLVLGVVLLIGMTIASISFGAEKIDFKTVIHSILGFNPQLQEHQIVMELRVPRVLGAAIVGCCFAVSGVLMQGMTRNPLADSGLLGLNAGAVFMLTICLAFFPALSYPYMILFSFLGAAIGAGIVYGVGSLSIKGLTPIRLVLAGAAVSALLGALSEGISLYFEISQDLAFWYASGVSGTRWDQIRVIGPWLLLMTFGAMFISRSITLLSLGEDTAKGLGIKLGFVKLISTVMVLVLAGVAVSVVGAVSFVGLIVPHLSRRIVGYDYRWILPASAIFGALLVVSADLASRLINPPFETPIGALISLIGVPFFLYLARKGREAS